MFLDRVCRKFSHPGEVLRSIVRQAASMLGVYDTDVSLQCVPHRKYVPDCVTHDNIRSPHPDQFLRSKP